MSRARAVSLTIARRGEVVVERDPSRPSGRLLRTEGMEASYIDLADPSRLEFDYLRWIRIVLRAAHARRILHVGGGACALARALAAADPGGRQEVCEVDADVLELAREHLGLRRAPGLHVRLADGRAYVGAQPNRSWDAIVIDAFVGATVPRRLITRQAFADAGRVAPLTLVNVVDTRSSEDVGTIAAGLAEAYEYVWALGGRTENTIVIGADEELNVELVTARVAADPSPAWFFGTSAVARLTAATPPLDDAEIEEG